VDEVFRALADPARRTLLDALFDRDGQTLGELCTTLPAMTRFGVMKHLGVLEAAGLVVTRRAGRAKHHFLNPVPIQLIADRWISKYAAGWTSGLAAFKRDLETESACPSTSSRSTSARRRSSSGTRSSTRR
jgi:DNA-binding transcriptional ArsR family regulator